MPMPSRAAGFLGSRPRTTSYSVVAPAKSEVRMPANERQAIVDRHIRACASNDVLVANLRGFVEPAFRDEGEEGPVEVDAAEFCRRRPGVADLALEPAILLEIQALSKFPRPRGQLGVERFHHCSPTPIQRANRPNGFTPQLRHATCNSQDG